MTIDTKIKIINGHTCDFHHCHILKTQKMWLEKANKWLHYTILRWHVNERFFLWMYFDLNIVALEFHHSGKQKKNITLDIRRKSTYIFFSCSELLSSYVAHEISSLLMKERHPNSAGWIGQFSLKKSAIEFNLKISI